jgi:hypothetical protein
MPHRLRFLILALTLILPLSTHAQGCSLCKDATAGSAPRQGQALRRAILILGLPAGAIFLGILALARRIKPREGLPTADVHRRLSVADRRDSLSDGS